MRKLALLLPLLLAACGEPPASPEAAPGVYVVHNWPLPATEWAGQPDLLTTSDGRLVLSWINSDPTRRNALRTATLATNGHWQSGPRTVVVGDSLLANWADAPHIAYTPGVLWVQWLQKAGDGNASTIALSNSSNAGFDWHAPVAVNDDATETEHGFASMWPAVNGNLGIAWLDGGGGTALRAAVFDRNLERQSEQVIDEMTCDCCQTSVAVTAKGPLLVYRDRTRDEIRDIAVTRFDGNAWSAPKPVHADGWKISACPVNGPAVAAEGNDAIVVWYTAADDTPRVLAARSSDAGDSFGEPVVLEQGDAVQGRVAVAMDARQAWILWVHEDAAGQSLWLSRRSPDLAKEYQRLKVAALQGRGKATGFPQIALRGDAAHVVWTDVVEGAPYLRGAIITPPDL